MNLKEWRESEGLSMREAARKCGVNERSWEAMEHRRHSPALETAVKILEASKGRVTLAELAKKGPGGR